MVRSGGQPGRLSTRWIRVSITNKKNVTNQTDQGDGRKRGRLVRSHVHIHCAGNPGQTTTCLDLLVVAHRAHKHLCCAVLLPRPITRVVFALTPPRRRACRPDTAALRSSPLCPQNRPKRAPIGPTRQHNKRSDSALSGGM